MNAQPRYFIKFKQGNLAYVRARLLKDRSCEQFAMLLGKTRRINGSTIITVIDLLFLEPDDYHQQSVAFLRIKKEFIHQALVEVTGRYDVDTIIDVHTHPFTRTSVSFSATDDQDEKTFFRFLKETFAQVHYASIVFSQRQYSARVWTVRDRSIVARRALIKTQTSPENITSADFSGNTDEGYERTALLDGEVFFNRSTLVEKLCKGVRHVRWS
jgi:hypothetical protein